MTQSVDDTNLCEVAFVPIEGVDFTLYNCEPVVEQRAWVWASGGPMFSDDYNSAEPFSSRAAAIKDAISFLTRVYDEPVDFSDLEASTTCLDIELSDTAPYQSGVHFALYTHEDREGFYWQGLCQEPNESNLWWGAADFSEFCSDTGYFNERYAAAAAIYCFHRLRKHSAVSSLTLCYELGLPIEQIVEEHFVRLTVSQASGYGSSEGDIEALSIEAKEEVCINRTEAAAFIAECHDWQGIAFTYEDGTTFTNAERYQEGYGVVLQIDTDDWAKWLTGYEIVEDVDSKYVTADLTSR